MFNINRALQFEAFQISAINSRKAAKPTQTELDSILLFEQFVIKTSYLNFKKNYLSKINYQKDLKFLEPGKSKDNTSIQSIIKFTQQIVEILYSQLIPECYYEVSRPCLQILKMNYQFFSTPETLEPKKEKFIRKNNFYLIIVQNKHKETLKLDNQLLNEEVIGNHLELQLRKFYFYFRMKLILS
ncbi:unnamed protein product [Paramecium sonneborni]|uniref:Uncharacterized protein n=1 Tax=Paramecium sonneborni TaxID=65129 RepID=A0A8S1R3B9_9CILI|nr:unnamed protein product [Paramecium sonneborni]